MLLELEEMRHMVPRMVRHSVPKIILNVVHRDCTGCRCKVLENCILFVVHGLIKRTEVSDE